MATHRRASRFTFAILAAVAVVATGAVVVRSLASDEAAAGPLQPDQPGPTLADAGLKPKEPAAQPLLAQIEQSNAAPTLTRNVEDLNVPATAAASGAATPATRPIGDASTVMREAAAKKQAGDLVTARDMVNDALAAGAFTGADVTQAKQFVGELNEKIILGTQKFPADRFNREWKVAPGTALWKLAKRFDTTAELLCRVNGLSSPNKLKAGVTIKAIQGPFHLVVSKQTFTAELYLGAPGGDGSMYVKTLKVGLGSDGSTPTGTWIVETGKVVDPVYYSPRGEGVVAADDPKNPLGERWIPLRGIEGECVGKESYGIHGTIEPDSIGKNMSMGCIRLLDEDVKLLYDLLIEGKSKVKVVN